MYHHYQRDAGIFEVWYNNINQSFMMTETKITYMLTKTIRIVKHWMFQRIVFYITLNRYIHKCVKQSIILGKPVTWNVNYNAG